MTSDKRFGRRELIIGGTAGVLTAAVAGAAVKRDKGEFSGKVILITGGTAGIGRATALAFAEHGAKICFCARHEELSAEVSKSIQRAGGEALFVKADIASPADIENLITKCVDHFGRIDVAFNNVGAAPKSDPLDAQDWKRVTTVNMDGTYYCMKFEITQMLKQAEGGVIINNASLFAERTEPGLESYCTSKFAVVGMTKAMAGQYAPKKIRINCISPGLVETESFELIAQRLGHEKKAMLQMIAAGRIAKPEDIAPAVIFMASKNSNYMYGTNLKLDGGFYLGL